MPDGSLFDRDMKRHHSPYDDISQNYDRIQPYMERRGLTVKGKFGNADCIVETARDIYSIAAELLSENINFFGG